MSQTPSSNGFLNSGREFQKFVMDMEYNTPRMEVINALLDASEMNRLLLADEFRYGPGQLREVKISYYPQRCDVVADTVNSSICETGTVQSPTQQWYQITNGIQTKPQRLYPNDVRYVDGMWSFSQHAVQQILSGLGALRKELAVRLTTDLIANKGFHEDGSEYGTRINLVYTDNGLLTPVGISTIRQEFTNLAYMDPFIIGYTQVFQWREFFGIATDNNTLGQAFQRINAPRMYYDVNLNTIKGVTAGDPEYIIAFDPRAVKFVTFSENAGKWSTDLLSIEDLDRMFANGNESVLLGAFVDPVTGLIFDLDVHKTICVDDSKTGAFDWKLTLIYDTFYTPIQTCNEQGINGIFEYKTCPVVLPSCPEGDTPSPAIAASDWTWTPGDIFPLLVSDITLGAYTNNPNVNVTSLAELAAVMGAAYNGQAIFSVDGSDITYSGFSQITGSINSGNITVTFAL